MRPGELELVQENGFLVEGAGGGRGAGEHAGRATAPGAVLLRVHLGDPAGGEDVRPVAVRFNCGLDRRTYD